jgi:hypothetical protein
VKVKAVVTEVWHIETDCTLDEFQTVDVEGVRDGGALVSRKMKLSKYRTPEEVLAENRKVVTPKRAESSRANANKPPKAGKMARGRPRKEAKETQK